MYWLLNKATTRRGSYNAQMEHQMHSSERKRLMLLLCPLNRADSQDQTILGKDKKHNIREGISPSLKQNKSHTPLKIYKFASPLIS